MTRPVTIQHFCYVRRPLGINNAAYEIVRKARKREKEKENAKGGKGGKKGKTRYTEEPINHSSDNESDSGNCTGAFCRRPYIYPCSGYCLLQSRVFQSFFAKRQPKIGHKAQYFLFSFLMKCSINFLFLFIILRFFFCYTI